MTGLAKTTRGPLFRQRERDPARGAKILGIGTAQSARKEKGPIFSRISLNADAVAVRGAWTLSKMQKGSSAGVAPDPVLNPDALLGAKILGVSYDFLTRHNSHKTAAEAQPRNLSSLRLAVYHH
jgi:hypothetical protein